MRYRLDAERLKRMPPMTWHPGGVFRSARSAPVGPTHAVDVATGAVDVATGAVACGIAADGLQVLNDDWEAAYFVEKCPGCFAAVMALG